MTASFAQTNLQLYQQMLESDRYTTDDVAAVADAYSHATGLFAGLFRGSGKTLLSHVVGTASIVAELGRPVEVVVAGVLHAARADGDFGALDGDEAKDLQLAEWCGPDVADLLRRYDDLGWSYDERTVGAIQAQLPDMDDQDREVVRLRLANELEDLLDLGILFCGEPTDTSERRKSAPWRLDYLAEHGSALVELAASIDEPDLATWISDIAAEIQHAAIPEVLRTGNTAMHQVTPPSWRVKRRPVRALRPKVRRARELGLTGTARAVRHEAERRLRRARRY